MDNKGKGTRRELQTKRLLEAKGFAVMKAGASLGVFDLIAISMERVLLIQVKANRWPRSPEMAAIAAFRCPDHVEKLVYRWVDRQIEPDVKRVHSIAPAELPLIAGKRRKVRTLDPDEDQGPTYMDYVTGNKY